MRTPAVVMPRTLPYPSDIQTRRGGTPSELSSRPTPSSLMSPCSGDSSRSFSARTTSCAAASASSRYSCRPDSDTRCDELSRVSGRNRQSPYAAVKRRDTLFENIRRGIHQPGVDVAKFLQPEKICGVLGTVEGVGSGLVKRNGARIGVFVDVVACVNL